MSVRKYCGCAVCALLALANADQIVEKIVIVSNNKNIKKIRKEWKLFLQCCFFDDLMVTAASCGG